MRERLASRMLGLALPLLLGATSGGCATSLEDDFENGQPSDQIWEFCKVDEDYLRAVAPGAHESRQAIGLVPMRIWKTPRTVAKTGSGSRSARACSRPRRVLLSRSAPNAMSFGS